jgi:hypothetical protein
MAKGVVDPKDVLPDGQSHVQFGDHEIRMGTVAAFIGNANALRATTPRSPDYQDIWQALVDLAPKLRAMGLFAVFSPVDPVVAALVKGTDSEDPK